MPLELPYKTSAGHLLASAAILLVLAFYPLSAMGVVTLWLTLIGSSFLIYSYLTQVMLLRRHAYIGLLTRHESHWRQRLWQSSWVQLLVALSSLALAAAALIASARLSGPEWAVIAGSVISFHLIQGALRPWVERHIEPVHQTSVALRVSHWLNIMLLVLALLALHYWVTEVPQTRHLSLVEVMQQAYQAELATAQLQLSGWMLGVNAALYSGFWHITQLISGTFPWWLTIAFWLVVMFAMVIQVALIWLLLLGAYALMSDYQASSTAPRRRFGRGLVIWLLVALVASVTWFVADSRLAEPWQGWTEGIQAQRSERGQIDQDPCSAERIDSLREDYRARNQALRTEYEAQVIARLHQRIEQALDSAYARSDDAVNGFLDWNFSLAGQYTQLAYLMRSSFTQQQFDQLMAEKIDVFMAASLQAPLESAQVQLNHDLTDIVQQAAISYRDEVVASPVQVPWCVELTPLNVDVDQLIHKSGVGAGVAPGLLLMSRALTPGAAVAGRAGTRRMFASVFARFSVRAGSSATAASAGSVCGPICMLILGGATWIGTDLVINYGDERLNREEMFNTLMDGVEAHQQDLEATLKDEAELLVHGVFSELEAQQEARFNLSRELR